MATLADALADVLGAKTAKTLAAELDLHTVEDLLRYYPRSYASQGQTLSAARPEDGTHVTLVGVVADVDKRPMRNRRGSLVDVRIVTEGRSVHATFFNAKVTYHIRPGKRGMFSGTVKTYRGEWGLTHPAYLMLPDDGDSFDDVVGSGDLAGMARSAQGADGIDMAIFARPQIPMYPATAKIQTWEILRCVSAVFAVLDPVADPLPASIRAERGLMDLEAALRAIHLAERRPEVGAAKERLRFDEAVALQLVLARRRHESVERTARECPGRPDGLAAEFDAMLPFELTAGQRAVAAEIDADLSRPHPMSRMLQGEVGSGKTIVALRAMLQVVDAGMQCALLAPTEVLAAQHYRSLQTMLGPLAMAGELGAAEHATRVALLTGSMTTAQKKRALLDVVTGEAGIVIGTHALIQDTVEFFDLGLVIVDEQHRFGVEQRDALRNKAKHGTPHLLVMTATPIPRTIAMTTLGDLETSTLRELPKGRSPITSAVVPSAKSSWVARAWSRILEEVAQGRQAYVVCSRIGGDEAADDAENVGTDDTAEGTTGAKGKKKEGPNSVAVLDLHDTLRYGPLASVRVGLLHGRLPADEKDRTMREFAAGEIDVLVCTTVVEVGVDVPNATTMVIVDAERFGVSQLHQLRGRVGRGEHAGLCILVSNATDGGTAFARLEQVAATNDGFELAQLDLRNRREGDVLGADQSGRARSLKLLSLLDHEEIIAAAQQFARDIVDRDPTFADHPALANLADAALDREKVAYLSKA